MIQLDLTRILNPWVRQSVSSAARSFLHFIHPGTAGTTSTFLFAWGMGATLTNPGDESPGQILYGSDSGILRNLTFRTVSAVADDVTVVVRVNNIDTAITATILDGSSSAEDNVHTVAVVRGDLISVALSYPGGAAFNDTSWVAIQVD